MRIFCAVRHSNDPRQFYGGLWTANFYPALRQLNHEIIESVTDLAPTSQFMSVATGFTPEELEVRVDHRADCRRGARGAATRAVDLFLSYFYNAHFDPSGFDELRKMGSPPLTFIAIAFINLRMSPPLQQRLTSRGTRKGRAEFVPRSGRKSNLASNGGRSSCLPSDTRQSAPCAGRIHWPAVRRPCQVASCFGASECSD